MTFEQILALLLFCCTVVAYLTLFSLGRQWRRKFTAKGIGYWNAPKIERMKELTTCLWRPRLIALFYALAYYANGYTKITFSIWASLYLLQIRGISTFEAARALVLYTSLGNGRCLSVCFLTLYQYSLEEKPIVGIPGS
jgi:hypothetical protein